MGYNLLENIQYCSDFVAEISDILLYSHIVPAVIALALAVFAYAKQKDSLTKTLLLICILFAVWVVLNLGIWFGYEQSGTMMFAWSQIEIYSAFISALTLFFAFEFLYGKQLPNLYKGLVLIPIVPVIVLSTSLFLTGYDPQECIAVENSAYFNYVTGLRFLLGTVIVLMTIHALFLKNFHRKRAEILVFGLGITTFLYTFFGSAYFADLSGDYRYEIAGLLTFTVFIGALTFLTVKYRSFDVRLLGTQVIVLTLMVLSGSQILFFSSEAGRIVDIATTALVAIFSYLLLRSIHREAKQREELEKLTTKLAEANEKLKQLDKLKSEFVSIASHQMRSPLTSIRGYASMLIEQNFGPMPEKAMDPLKRIEDSAKHMAMAVEDYLNVSRIESGNMKYNNSDFNLRDETEKICDDIRSVAMEKQLVLLFRTDLKSKGIVNADVGKTVQILHNIINNSMKYTERGSITVYMRDDLVKKRIYIDVIDTGIGINSENITKLFQKFSRATNANSVNVTGTGLGLFVARQMAVAMGGDITARSEGDGKGSTFTFELPLMM